MPREFNKLNLSLKITTGIYLFCSAFGLPLYMSLSPLLAAVGVRLPVYLFLAAAFGEIGPDIIVSILLIIPTCILALAIVVTGIIAMIKERWRLYTILVVLENILTLVFVLSLLDAGNYEFQMGILINIAYCIWLLCAAFVKKPAEDNATSFRKEK